MGTEGFKRAVGVRYAPGSVILEVGFQRGELLAEGQVGSTDFLRSVGPPVHVIDVDEAQVQRARELRGVTAWCGRAEDVLREWDSSRRVGFAWLDGHDWPYAHAEAADPGVYRDQRAEYQARGQEYSREASGLSHLAIAELLLPHVIRGGLLAFDDTWQTPSVLDDDQEALKRGWNGKGGLAVPWLIQRGCTVVESGDIYHGVVVVRVA